MTILCAAIITSEVMSTQIPKINFHCMFLQQKEFLQLFSY